MTPGGRLAWALAGVGLLILAAGVALRPEGVMDEAYLLAIAVPFAGVGALLAARRSANPIGWLFLGFGVLATIEFSVYQYAYQGIVAQPGSLAGADVAASVAAHHWHASFGLFVFSFLLFPNGRLLSPRWRWMARATVVTYLGMAISGIFESDFTAEVHSSLAAARPLFGGALAEVAAIVFAVLLLVNLALLAISAVCLLLRLRRSTGAERQQMKWFVLPVALVMLAFPVSIAVVGDGSVGVLLIPLVPISAGYAILRHRLYDIDVVVNRALVYGALTAILAGAYLGIVLLLGLALSPLTEQSDLAIAGSTLAVAALFRPARRSVQAIVDRRFYRRKYDAARILEGFSARLRAETDLDALRVELTGVVRETMQPAHVSLWLRDGVR